MLVAKDEQVFVVVNKDLVDRPSLLSLRPVLLCTQMPFRTSSIAVRASRVLLDSSTMFH